MGGAITLWGRETSCNVQKVIWALEEVGVGYVRFDVGGRFGGLDRPSFKTMNPNQTIPVLQNGDLTLWESHTILRYIAATYGAGTLWRPDPGERAIADQWTDWTATVFQPAWISLFWSVVRTPVMRRDAKTIRANLENTMRGFRILDERLSKVPYLAGGAITYADIAAGVSLYRWERMDLDHAPLPHVAAWYKRLAERRPFVKGVCISFDELMGREEA